MAKVVRPKYQVFISSTYENLRPERKAITWALLSARYIPVGMENFTPSDDRGWKTIQAVIDTTDYYLLILTNYYGTPDQEGMSWTEKEYRYAWSKKIPVLVFVKQEKPIAGADSENDLRRKAFHDLVVSRHLVKPWRSRKELEKLVPIALENHIKDDEYFGKSRPGWYRGGKSKKDKQGAINTTTIPAEYHGLTYEELKVQMQNEVEFLGWGSGDTERYTVWEFFLKNAASLSKRDIWKDSVTGQNCKSLVGFDLVRVSANDYYGLTDLGFKLIGEARKKGDL